MRTGTPCLLMFQGIGVHVYARRLHAALAHAQAIGRRGLAALLLEHESCAAEQARHLLPSALGTHWWPLLFCPAQRRHSWMCRYSTSIASCRMRQDAGSKPKKPLNTPQIP